MKKLLVLATVLVFSLCAFAQTAGSGYYVYKTSLTTQATFNQTTQNYETNVVDSITQISLFIKAQDIVIYNKLRDTKTKIVHDKKSLSKETDDLGNTVVTYPGTLNATIKVTVVYVFDIDSNLTMFMIGDEGLNKAVIYNRLFFIQKL